MSEAEVQARSAGDSVKVVILIPAYNEEMTIAKVILGCFDYCDEVVVLDDGSKDATAKIAEGLGAILLRHEKNEGKGEALRSLFLKAIDIKADQVVTIDADGQHDPMEIPKLLIALKNADMVIGGRKDIPTTRAVGNLLLSGFNELDTQSGFRAYRGSILPLLIPSEMGMAVDSEIFREAKKHGLRIAQVDISVTYAVPRPSKSNMVFHFLDVLFTQFKLATFRHPLVLYGIPGLVVFLTGLWFAYASIGRLLEQGFGSIVLILIGLSALSTAIIIWTVISMIRKTQR